MRTGYFYSLVFALLASASIGAIAAPAANQSHQSHQETSSATVGTVTSDEKKVDLNVADAITLQRELSGVGEAKAKAIVAYRETNGPFASVEELLEVKGIGKAILDRNRDKLEIN